MIKKLILFCFSFLFIISLIFLSCSKSENPTSPTNPQPTKTWTPDWSATITKTMTHTPTITATFATYVSTPTQTWSGGADAFEPDNDYNHAKDIINGEMQARSIHVWDDVDWIKFTILSDFEFSIITSGPNNPLTYIEVYKNDPTGSTYCTGGDGNGPAQILNYQFNEPGTYYIKIRPWNYEPISLYYLQLILNIYATPTETITPTPTISSTFSTELPTSTITLTLTPSPFPTDIYEPDNNTSEARALTPGIEYDHTLHSESDEDWFYFNINSPSVVDIRSGEDNIGYNKLMTIYDEYLNILDTAGGNPYAISTREYWTPGKYYVKIYPWGGMNAVYNIEFNLTQFTPSNTPVYSPSPTFTPTYQMDTYEPDDDYLSAKTISRGETQIRSIVPRANDDFIKYDCPGNEVITSYCSGDTNSYYKVDYLIATPDIYGYTREESTSDEEIVILEQFTPGPVYIRVQGDQSFSYSFSLVAHSMTPTFTFTATPTITPTFTITQTGTITQTPTNSITSTVTPTNTPKWIVVATYGANVSEPKIYSNGISFSYSYISANANVIVNGFNISGSVNESKMGGKWVYKNSNYTYLTFTDASNNIYAQISSSWGQNLGNTTVASGYFPNIFSYLNTPYVGYINSSNNKISVRYFDGSNWLNYGAADFSTTVKHTIGFGNPMVMDGYSGTSFNLYVAYINDSDGKVYCYYHNGSNWQQLGTNPVSETLAYDIDISVLDNSNIYIAYLYNYPERIYVKRFNGTDWENVGSSPAIETTTNISAHKNISIFAHSSNDIWVAYKTQYSYYYVIKTVNWDGNIWQDKGSPDGLTGGVNPTITFVNNIPYTSFSNGSQLIIRRLE